jgi:secreted PhoX family phosphatase
MPGNATPQFTKNGIAGAVRVTAANTSSEGDSTIGTSSFLVFTADATNGSFVEFVRWMPRASVALTATTATVGRLFLSTQSSGATTNANTNLLAEVTLPSVTADSNSQGNSPIDIPLNIRIPAGQSLLATTHAAPAANTSWGVQAFGGDY